MYKREMYTISDNRDSYEEVLKKVMKMNLLAFKSKLRKTNRMVKVVKLIFRFIYSHHLMY